MITKTKVLRFDKATWDKPVVCELAKKFNITYSILRAEIFPREAGVLVLEIKGTETEYKKAINYIKSFDVKVEPLEKEIKYINDICINCGACLGFCPSKALQLSDPVTREIEFVSQKCIGCKICLTACPSRALILTKGSLN